MEISGKSVSGGIAVGKMAVLAVKAPATEKTVIENVQTELQRFYEAQKTAADQLEKLYRKALEEVGEGEAAIFEMQGLLLEDNAFVNAVLQMITDEKVNAEYAVMTAAKNIADKFAAMQDEIWKARSADFVDVGKYLVSALSGEVAAGQEPAEPAIVLADDMTPGELMGLNRSNILALVTRQGSLYSHTAILAGSMGIPALVGVDYPADADGKIGIVDGVAGKTGIAEGGLGKLIIDPSEDVIREYRKLLTAKQDAEKRLQEQIGKETVTRDGRKIALFANIESVEETAQVLACDAEGIGLFRSEFLFLGRSSAPTEEEQFRSYKSVAEKLGGKKVIIRTMDIGADKQVDYLGLSKEENPALGCRGIRLCLERQELFKVQLRAIYRAGYYGNIAVKFPMVTSVEEVRKIKGILQEVKDELTKEGIPFKDLEIGIMIETPAAVLLSEELAQEVDFFSIGTNDLTQYTLAIDRQNAGLEAYYNPHHPAILKMIRMTVENGHKRGCRVGICGELAGDFELTETFLRMGVDELSVNPGKVLQIRERVRELDLMK